MTELAPSFSFVIELAGSHGGECLVSHLGYSLEYSGCFITLFPSSQT